jgi:hypothetical protein
MTLPMNQRLKHNKNDYIYSISLLFFKTEIYFTRRTCFVLDSPRIQRPEYLLYIFKEEYFDCP